MPSSLRFVMVVGVDFSDQSDLALRRAFELGLEQRIAEIHAVHVVRSFESGVQLELPTNLELSTVSLAEAGEQMKLHLEERLSEFARSVEPPERTRAIDRVVSHIRLDAPAEQIAQLAADLEADLVVVGTHGRRGLSRVVMGSVAEGVVRLAPCPVLVVREKKISEAPRIEPPCPRCVETRRETGGREFWCEQHSERHGRRHTYFSTDRVSRDANLPLVFPER
jgi:nucleotide-binding universal stress UspA family protein